MPSTRTMRKSMAIALGYIMACGKRTSGKKDRSRMRLSPPLAALWALLRSGRMAMARGESADGAHDARSGSGGWFKFNKI